MSRLITIFLSALMCAVISSASDKAFRDGIPGAYSRLVGMEATVIELRRDGSYVITTQGCVWSEEGIGRWAVHNGSLVLDGRGHPEERKEKLTKFEIVTLDGDLALRPLNDFVESDDRDSEVWLFRPVKKTANQMPEPTGANAPVAHR